MMLNQDIETLFFVARPEYSFLSSSIAKEIAYLHHEKYDGSGYPLGLKGDVIPISARLMAVADVYDALISKRIYKDSMNHQDAIKIMKEGSGIHFDPDILDAFLELEKEFEQIAKDLSDNIKKNEI